jgi:hypothetical protein
MGKIEKASSNGTPLFVRPNSKQGCGTLMFLCLSCVSASAAFVAVEFEGRLTYSSTGGRVGERMVGYFTYDADLPPGRQTNSRPILVFGNPEVPDRNEFYWYDFSVYNNRVWDPSNPVPLDGIDLKFPFVCCSPDRYGYLSLWSSNTSLFANNLLPQTIPALEQFDANRALVLTIDDVEPEQITGFRIERLSVVPGSGLSRPLIFGLQRAPAGLSFRFLTEPSTAYTVQFTGNLTNPNWVTLTNIASAREPIVTVKDEAALEQRFYRVRKE